MAQQVATVVQAVRATSREQQSSMVVVAVGAEVPLEPANTVGEMAHQEQREIMVSITRAEALVHQLTQATCRKVVMASSLCATRHQ